MVMRHDLWRALRLAVVESAIRMGVPAAAACLVLASRGAEALAARCRRTLFRAVLVPHVARAAQRELSLAPRAYPDPKLDHAMASAIVAVDFENGP